MARMTMESIDEKIKKAEDRVAKIGRIYNDACEELQKLREKKVAIENEALVAAFMKSSKSLEEAIAFFESETIEKEDVPKPKRRGGRRKESKIKNLKFHQVLCQK